MFFDWMLIPILWDISYSRRVFILINVVRHDNILYL